MASEDQIRQGGKTGRQNGRHGTAGRDPQGAWIYRAMPAQTVAQHRPQFPGHIIQHLMLDPRDGKPCWPPLDGIWATIFRSTDMGKSWKEARVPRGSENRKVAHVNHTFWLTPAHKTNPMVWYAAPRRKVFRSEDGGVSWNEFSGLN